MKKLPPLRAAKALFSLAQLVRDPNKLGQVFEMADALADEEGLTELVDRLSANPDIKKALAERHRMKIDLKALAKLPEGTLGRVFADKMNAAGLDPSALPDLASPNPATYFRAHLYETHDVWHAVTGFGMDVYGEIGLQAFYLAQIESPLPLLLLAVGFLRMALYEVENGQKLMNEVARGYAMGKQAQTFFGVHWDELWSLPLAEVRRRLNVQVEDAAPVLKAA
jgi:ubiquinone biosynthesis protein Coq4